MGNRQTNQHEQIKKRYLKALEEAQLDFLNAERRSDDLQGKHNLASFVVSAPEEPLDWKIHLETYLDVKKDTYFWAKELLQYDIKN